VLAERVVFRSQLLPDRSRTVGPVLATSLGSMPFYALFACMPLSGLWPIWLMKCFPGVIFAVVLIVFTPHISRPSIRNWGFLPFFLGMALLATVSLLVNGINEYALACYFGCYPAALIIYLAVRFRTTSNQEYDRAMMVYSVVAMVPLVLGIHAFYTIYGMPDLSILMNARFDETMDPYRQITWGNVTNTASYLIEIVPLFIVFTLDRAAKFASRCWFGLCSLICLANLLLINTRSAFLVFAAVFAMALLYSRQRTSKLFFIVLIVPIVLGLQLLSSDGGRFWDYMQGVTHLNSDDRSVVERVDSIVEGWGVLGENPMVGVGAGNSLYHISQSAVHQMALQQGVEYGVLGFLGNITMVVLVLWKTNAALLMRRVSEQGRRSFACLLSASSYLAMGTIANACTNAATMNPWIVTLAATLALVDGREDQLSPLARTTAKPRRIAGQRPNGSITRKET
jgi:hypothetical protein